MSLITRIFGNVKYLGLRTEKKEIKKKKKVTDWLTVTKIQQLKGCVFPNVNITQEIKAPKHCFNRAVSSKNGFLFFNKNLEGHKQIMPSC